MLSIWWLAIRPKTLPASISPILLASAIAYYNGLFRFEILLLACLCALFLQISVNLANDWFDGKSGVDTPARLGPTRVTQSQMITSRQMQVAIAISITASVTTGISLIMLSSVWLLLAGVFAIIGVFAYSGGPRPLASLGLGEFTVFVYFGLLAVGGCYFAHSNSINVSALIFGAIMGLFSAAIMLVNNIRDIHTDTVATKRTLAVRIGDKAARQLYVGLLIGAMVLHAVQAVSISLWLLVSCVLMLPLIISLILSIHQQQGAELNSLLAKTAGAEMVYCALTGSSLVLLTCFTSNNI